MGDVAGGARRCGVCGISWPNLGTYYGKCPQCLGDTSYISNPSHTEMLTRAEALEKLNQINFERYCRGELLLPAPPADAATKERAAKVDQERIRHAQFDAIIKSAYAKDELEKLGRLGKQLGATSE